MAQQTSARENATGAIGTPDSTRSTPQTADAAPPCVMVIFGASGDLTKRLVVPALYNLATANRLSDNFRLVGVDLVTKTTDEWRQGLDESLQEFVQRDGELEINKNDDAARKWLMARMSYVQGDLNDPQAYQRLKEHLEQLDAQAGTSGNYLFYLAIADRFFCTVVNRLGEAGLATESEDKWRRVVIEKPFGHDLVSAEMLNAEILKTLREHQVYRIDHFLGKETVQNIMALRFANGLFEPLWSRLHIDHVQITAAETVGVERRGKFYDITGALRDMVPNHLFQLLAMTAMEPPISFEADAVRAKQTEVLEAIRPFDAESALKDTVRGQYDAGNVLNASAQAYRNEPDVSSSSNTETYFACKLQIDNWRWSGVPFYIRTGKHLTRRSTEIAIRFHQAPYTLFRGTDVQKLNPNWMILRIQPDEGIAIEFAAKHPGTTVKLNTVSMDFDYKNYFQVAHNTGYETLIYDCMIGDATLFKREDNVIAGWKTVQPILDTWAENPPTDFPNYTSGTSGPASADELLARDGRAWRPLVQ